MYRFIPASAGNGYCDVRGCHRGTVHPRERGERISCEWSTSVKCGSSPRARGTVVPDLANSDQRRFIPASAGNGGIASSRFIISPVHPRERGERWDDINQTDTLNGSSPRARGTDLLKQLPHQHRRFIPASAGNGRFSGVKGSMATVHPRERGERCGKEVRACAAAGSSPRARGTGVTWPAHQSSERFIPASAGNGVPWPLHAIQGAVHPRERGERSGRRRDNHHRHGSSPRARGTVPQAPGWTTLRRFIPASAGNGSGAFGEYA